MYICLNQELDKKKFLNRLFLYKSFIYKKVIFESDTTDVMYLYIIEALNIKNRKKRITYVYDTLCYYIDNLNSKKNICGFINGQCYMQQLKNNHKINGCCRKCKFLGNNGCTTSNLTCKFFNCSPVRCRYNVLDFKDAKLLRVLSVRQRDILKNDYFSSRDECLKDLYSYSYFYTLFNMIYRQLRWILFHK